MKIDVKTIGVLFVIVLVIAGVAYMGMRPETPSEEAEEVPNGSPTSQEPSETTPETPGEEPVTLKIPPRPEAPYIPEGTPYGWAANYTKIYSNDFESATYSGVVVNGELVTEGVLDGVTSVKLSQYQGIETDPTLLPLEGDTYYVFELDYRIIDAGSGEYPLWINLRPEGSMDEDESVVLSGLLSNAEPRGTFSFGGLTPGAPNYYLTLTAATGTKIVIDNLRIFRLDPLPVTSPPEGWGRLAELSYPRLGNYQLGTPLNWAEGTGMAPDWPEGELVHELDEYLEKLSLFDVVAGPAVSSQTKETFFVKRLRELNPDIVIVPYMIYAETDCFFEPPRATIDLTYDFYSRLPQQWVMKDTHGGPLECVGFPGQFIMNIFDDCPTVGGQTYTDAVIDHMVDDVMASGIWDGIMIDNTIPNVNHYIPDSQNPSLIDFDINLNGQRDETSAQISDQTEEAWISFMERLRAEVGDNEIIIGNAGFTPYSSLAPYLDGYIFEILLDPWFMGGLEPNEGAWRTTLDLYYMAQERTQEPHLNILEAAGHPLGMSDAPMDRNYLEPTAEDIYKQRLGLGTALLGDGFYEYDLFDNRAVPYWFDEYMVDEDGVAVEDPGCKGYLGMPLGDAVELRSPETLLWEEGFEGGAIPSDMQGEGAVEDGRLVIYNPDHTAYKQTTKVETKTGSISFSSGKTYIVEFDWEILETIDDRFFVGVTCSDGVLGSYTLPEVFAGSSGKVRFPVTLNYGSNFKLELVLTSGGGRVAVDNVKVYEGGAGPWRRDFENGFVLVNPLNKPYTFTAEELAGSWSRTDIKHIQGTQAPEVNNGEPVTDTLTLQPFDTIILLTDHVSSP
jgi:hypothetical protein